MAPIKIIDNEKVSLEFNEAAGVGSLKLSVKAGLGGGLTADALKAIVSAELDVSAKQMVDALFALAKAKFPSLSSELALAQGLVDAELAKI